MIGAVELGGTSCRVSVAERGVTKGVPEVHSIETGDQPVETLAALASWLEARGPFEAIGIASFGPLELRERHQQYGCITTTPKPGWACANVVGPFRRLARQIAFDTDVNCAAIAEAAHARLRNCVYVTVGTGVGVGLVVEGLPVHGAMHPEMGHIRVPRRADDREFPGTCPFHGDCLEGLVTNRSLASRLGCGIADLPGLEDSAPVWGLVAEYLAHLCCTLTLTLAPERIVLGGGIMMRSSLFPMIRARTMELINGYVQSDPLRSINTYIVPSIWKDQAGIMGAFHCAQLSLQQ